MKKQFPSILKPSCIYVCAVLMLVNFTSCIVKEPIPPRDAVPVKHPERMLKSISYGDSRIFLQTRKKGILTNDLILEEKDGSLRYLSQNRFFIVDFCLSDRGILYYCEAGFDYGYEVGTRGHDFKLKKIDLNNTPTKVESILPGIALAEPHRLELSHDQKFLCFGSKFGDVHVIDLASLKEINIIPSNVDPDTIYGLWLTADKKSFIVREHKGSDETGRYIWERREFPLP